MLGEPGFSLPERTTVVNLHSSTSESLEVNEIHAFKLVYETKMNVGTRKSRKTGSLQPLLRRNFKKNCAAEAVFEHGSMTPGCCPTCLEASKTLRATDNAHAQINRRGVQIEWLQQLSA